MDMANGELADDIFRYYLIQDAQYLPYFGIGAQILLDFKIQLIL